MKSNNINTMKRGSRSLISSTLTMTVGSPSRFGSKSLLKLVSVLALIFTLDVGNAWGGQYVYDFSTTSKWYTTSAMNTNVSTGSSNNYTSIYDTDGIEWTAGGTSHYFNSGYYLMGKSGAYLNLPTYTGEKITSIVIHSSSGHSTSVSVNITANGTSATTGGQTWSTKNKDYVYAINTSYQASALRVQVTNGNNTQFTRITINTAPNSSCAGTQLTTPDVTSTPSNGQIQLSWPAVTNATKYQVSWNGGSFVDATSPFTKISLTNGTAYTWAVRAVGNGSTYCNSEANEGVTKPSSTIRTITWKVNGQTYATTYVADGDHLMLPTTPSSCIDGKVFAGWSAATIIGTTDTKPTFVSSQTTISANQTYHAVFATRATNSYTKGDINDLFPGQTALIVNVSNNKALSDEYVANNQDKKLQKVDVSISSNTISSANSHLIWTVENSGLKYNFKTGTGYLRAATVGNDKLSCNRGADPWTLTAANTGTYYMNSNSSVTSRIEYYSSYFTTYGTNATGAAFEMSFFVPTCSGYFTSCCTELGSINGSVSWSNPTEAVVTWDKLDDQVSAWALSWSPNTTGSSITSAISDKGSTQKTATVSGLACGTAYTFTLTPTIKSGVCTPASNPTIESTSTKYAITLTDDGEVTGGLFTSDPEEECASEIITLEAAPNTGFEFTNWEITYTESGDDAWDDVNGDDDDLVSDGIYIEMPEADITVNAVFSCVEPVIGTQPSDASYIKDASPSALSVSATLASGTLTYLWKVSTDGGSSWSNAGGTNNTASYSGSSLSTSSTGTLKFKCIVGNSEGGCTVESNVATITITNASNFVNGETVFIQAESNSAWDASACVKAWFNTSGEGGSAETTYWLFDATGGDSGKKLFAAIVPDDDLNQVTLQRFASDCDPKNFLNNNGTLTKASSSGSNTFRSTGSGTSNVAWNNSGVTMELHGDPSGDEWASKLADVTDQGGGIWSGTYEDYAPANAAGTSQDFKIKTNYNGWIGNTGSNSNATLDGMKVGSTYDITATLDVTDHSLTMSKTFVKGTVHFDMQSHGSAISDLTNVTAGSKISAPSTPTAAGYVFGGWYKEAGCVNAWNFASDVVNETMTLYAKWYQLTLVVKDEDATTLSGGGMPTLSHTGGTALTAAEAGNYVFKQITITSGTGTLSATNTMTPTITAISSNLTITAVFYKPVTVAWTMGGTTYSTGTPTTSVARGTQWKNLTLPTAPDDDALSDCADKFMGWSNLNVEWMGTSHDEAPATCLKSFSGVTTEITEPITFKAVFATESGGDYEYVLTPAASLAAGEYVIAAYDDSNEKYVAATGDLITSSGNVDMENETTGFTISEGKFTSLPTGTCLFVLSAYTGEEESGFYIQHPTTDKLLDYTDNTTNRRFGYYATDEYVDGEDNPVTPWGAWKGIALAKDGFPDNGMYLRYVDETYSIFTNGSGTTFIRGYKNDDNKYKPVYLFKKSGGYTYADYVTKCCTPLDDINGSVNWSNPTTAVVSWDNIGHVSSWTVKYKTHDAGEYGTWAGEQTVYTKSTTNDSRKVTITGLTPCVDYDFQIIATPASDYCEKDETIEDDQTHTYSVDYSGCSNVTKTAGDATTCASSNLVATFTASLPYELPTSVSITIGGASQTQGTDFTWSVSDGVGTLTIGKAKITGNIVIDVDGNLLTCDNDPEIGTAELDGSGSFSLSSVAVTVADCDVNGVVCEWTDYGFVWGTSANPTVSDHKVQVGTSGDATSWSGSLTGTFETGTTYYYRAYGKNSKDGAAISYGSDATFIPRSVTFNSNGGSSVDTKYVHSGGTVSAPSDPAKSGYEFGGWYTDNGTWESAVNWSSTISSNVTYYAKWNAITYTITYEGLSGASNTNPTSYNIETPTITLADPGTRTGYTFDGWTCGGDAITQITVGSTGNKTITANWTINQYNVAVEAVAGVTITATPAGGSAIEEGDDADVDYNKSVTLAYSDLGTGIYWAGWKVTNAGGDDVTTTVVSSNTLTVPAYAVTVTAVLGKMKAWCMPEFEVTGDIHLTSYNGVYVNSTSTTGDLLTVSGTNTENVTKISIDYLDNNGDVVATKSSSPLRLYNSAGSSLAESNITTGFSTGTYEGSFSVRFTPTAYDELDNYTLRLSIYKGSRVLKTVEHPMNGRALPEEFVIAVKQNDQWYALPNTILDNTNAITPLKITVNNASTPTAATYAPTTAVYKGYSRYAAEKNIYGVRLIDPDDHWLQVSSSSGTNYVWVSGSGSSTCQDWWLSSSDFSSYTLKVPSSGAGDKSFGINNLGNIGFHPSNASNLCKEVYLLPITNKYTDFPATVTEWGQSSVILAVNAASADHATAQIETGDATSNQTITPINETKAKAKNFKVTLGDIDLDVAEGNEGKLLYINWLDGGGVQLGRSCVTIPRIVAEDRTANKTNDTDKKVWNTEVHVLPGATLTIDGNTFVTGVINSTVSVKELHVYPGATINVSTGKLSASTLRLRNGWTRAGTKKYDVARVYINASNDAALEKTTASMDYDIYEQSDGKHYYPLAVPFRTKVKEIDYADTYLAGFSTYSTTGSNGQYAIKTYDGARRATSGEDQTNNWALVPEEKDAADVYLEPGKGYIMTAVAVKGEAIIRVPLTFDNGWTADGEKASYGGSTKNVVAVTAYGGAAATAHQRHKGWNMLGVPFMSCYGNVDDIYSGVGAAALINGELVVNTDADQNMEYQSTTIPYVSVPSHDFAEYIQTDITETKLLPGWSFFVQVDADGDLTFAVSNQRPNNDNPIYAPKRSAVDEVLRTGIILSDGEASDKTTILISNRYSSDYEIGADLEKMFGNGYTLATYSLSGSTRLAYNAMSKSDATAVIPIGYRAPAEGEYTFSLNPRYAEANFERVDLIDYQTGSLTNLMTSSYTFTTGRMQDDSRFALNVVMKPTITTDVENGANDENDANGVEKVIIDDHMYIIRSGKMYDATGKTVREINK